MQDFKRINNISGWIIFAIATLVYWLTVEPTASYWDCGEFIAVSYKLEVPHPPGAPLFLLIGRMFSFLAMGDVEMVAYWINVSSAIASGFTILFLFWSITLLGRKMFAIKAGEETPAQTWLLVAGGAIGALCYTFSDSFWFSAVESEVYALSSFFTALVVWAMLKWDTIEDEKLASRWIILICYAMGLSIGIHLLNLVTIPALALIYFFKKYNPSVKGIAIALGISLLILFIINDLIIPGLPSLAGTFEIFFVNSLGLPFGSGIIVFVILFISAVVYGVYFAQVKKQVMLSTILLGLTFILIGYSSYAVIVIRSNYNPPIDENNPENIISFVSYLKREQYGSRPLIKGQYFDANAVDQKKGDPVYVKGENSYEISDYKISYVYDPARSTILPRVYSNDPRHVEEYRRWMNLGPNEKPNFRDNLTFMFRYQIGFMYMRYFMWNFSGRESDIQGASWLTPFDSLKDVPEQIANNKGRNQYFMLPLLIGLIGMFFHYMRDPKNFAIVGLLFVMTGVALVVYLNSPPVEPRERDYIYVGSFYAFAMWIGFGAMAIGYWLYSAIKSRSMAALVAFVICLPAPVIMAAQGWDDHDRSNRYFSVDSAKNFLASCAPNAILFTGGDNDTFPLWYVQEVEGFRTDVRVIVLSYFNTDWYIEQMTRPINKSDALPFSLDKSHYKQGGLNDYLPYSESPNITGAISLNQYLRLVRQNHAGLRMNTRMGSYNTLPSRNLYLNVDSAAVVSKNLIPEDKLPYLAKQMRFELKQGKNGMEKNTLMILDFLVANNWERPIYFNSTSLQGVSVKMDHHVIQEGNAYRLLPVNNPSNREEFVNTEVMYDNMMYNFHFRELDNPSVYYNDDYRSFALNHRSSFNSLAAALLNKGDIEKAREVVNRSLETIPDKSIPYDYTTAQMINLLFAVGERDKAMEIAGVLGKRADDMLNYFFEKSASMGNETQKNLIVMNELIRTLKAEGENEMASELEAKFMQHYSRVR
ncbi:MAG: DUF2723 domain-containing protein [Cyclobacteriaceae bacterium]